MIKPPRNTYGYRNLLVYQKAEALQLALAEFVKTFPRHKTLADLADQMERSARSTKQNIIEGWKRNSTNEYYQFLGYAMASNAELEGDCTDICIGIYEAKGLKGVGPNGIKGVEIKGLKGEERGEKGGIETIPFYPLDPLLPLPVQLKLRAKELNFLLEQLQQSLLVKMRKERTLSTADRIRSVLQKEAQARKEREAYIKAKGWG